MTLEQLRLAIAQAEYFGLGDITLKGNDAKERSIRLEYPWFMSTAAGADHKECGIREDVLTILTGMEPRDMFGNVPNQMQPEVEKSGDPGSESLPPPCLMCRHATRVCPTAEIDVAVVARLICDQKVTIKQAGSTIVQTIPNPRYAKDRDRENTDFHQGRCRTAEMKAARVPAEYFEVMTLPEDEDGLILWIIDQFGKQKEHYADLQGRYKDRTYPDRSLVDNGISLIDNLLSQQKDNIALVQRLLKLQDDFINHKQKMARVEGFFQTQQPVFDSAVKLTKDLSHELDYLSKEEEANQL